MSVLLPLASTFRHPFMSSVFSGCHNHHQDTSLEICSRVNLHQIPFLCNLHGPHLIEIINFNSVYREGKNPFWNQYCHFSQEEQLLAAFSFPINTKHFITLVRKDPYTKDFQILLWLNQIQNIKNLIILNFVVILG